MVASVRTLPPGGGSTGGAFWLVTGQGQCSLSVVLFQLTRSPCCTFRGWPRLAPSISGTKAAVTPAIRLFEGTIFIDQSGMAISPRDATIMTRPPLIVEHKSST